MKSFSSLAIQHKNQIEATAPFIVLFEFEDNSVTTKRYRITNFDQVVYWGQDDDGEQIPYYPCPMYIGDLEENSDGDLRQFSVAMSIPGPITPSALSANNGFAGKPFRAIVVSAQDLSSGVSMIDEEGEIISTELGDGGVAFQIGGANLFNLVFPQMIYSPGSCIWTFGSQECGYNVNAGGGFDKCGINTSGTQVARPYSYRACELVGEDEDSRSLEVLHPKRFGGAPGMSEL